MEIDRQKRVLSMMITGHSVLRDRYARLASIFENGLLVSAAVLNCFVFVDEKFISGVTSLSLQDQKVILGVASIIVFIVSIVLLQVKWKEKAENHSKAADQLFILLQECRTLLEFPDGQEKDIAIAAFSKQYGQIMGIIVKIPDSQFNKLKLIHLRKIELSKLIDRHPGSLLLILKIKLFLSSFKTKQ